MDTLSDPSARTAPADDGLPRILRDDGPIAKRLPAVWETLARVWQRYVPDAEDRPRWGDLWAVLLLAASTIYLVGRDGGRPRGAAFLREGLWEQLGGIAPVLVLAIAVLVTSTEDIARERPLTRWLMLGWSVGPLIALAFAGIRDGWVRSLAALALAVPLFIAARRVWRARWGPPALGGVVVMAGFTAWATGFFLWTSSANIRHWPLLSWHNQTATVMGVLLLVGLAVAWTSRRWVRAVGLVLAVCGGSGLWLAASRGAFVLTLLGLGVALAIALRSPYARASIVLTALAAVLVVPTVLVVSEARVVVPTSAAEGSELDAIEGLRSERALLDRGTDVANLTMRFDYWRGALAMFRSAPLTGTGPGSFPNAAPPHLRPDYFPTLSTHNEYLDVLGGMGLVGAVPVWAAALGLAWLSLRVLRRPTVGAGEHELTGADGLSPGRWGGRMAAVGSLALLGTHAGMDLDWLWPLLLGGAAISAGVLHAEVVPHQSEAAARPVTAGPIVAGIVLAGMTAAGALAQQTTTVPWDLSLATQQIMGSVEAGEPDEARRWLDTLERWNGGSYDAEMARALVAYAEGRTSAEDVVASIHPRGVRFPVQVRVASHLLEAGEVRAADAVLTALRPHLEGRPPGREPGRQAAFLLELDLEVRRGDCRLAEGLWDEGLRERIRRAGINPEDVARGWHESRNGTCVLN